MNNQSKNTADIFNQLFLIENNWQNVLYIHSPFCLRKCHYCIYGSRVPSSMEELENFFHKIISEQIERYKPVLENAVFDQVYFGGGTPTITDAGTLESVYRRIPRFRDIPVRATEVSPYTVTDEHLQLFHEYGFSYVSMGVQTLDKRVLEKENRLAVNNEKLNYLCRRLDEYGTISNVDLIFFLDTGEITDLEITRRDLETMMGSIRPVSMTLYTNYRVPKSFENRKGTIRLVREMLGKYPEYRCINSALDESETEVRYEMENSVEYRLMRTKQDFEFYMLQKVPQIHPYGYNMLAIGEYMNFKPRYNYYYILDFIDKYMWKDCFQRARDLDFGFEETRKQLGLPYRNFRENNKFFIDETGKEKFKDVIKQAGYPYYEF